MELQFFSHEEGRVRRAGNDLVYETFLKDHLGNTRVMFSDLDENGWIDPAAGGGEVIQIDHYYPFGMRMSGTSPALATAAMPNGYLYNGKELQDELGLGWHDYGARMYDASVGRWNGVDVLADSFLMWSPYNYVLGNPLLLIDPDGRDVNLYDEEGNQIVTISKDGTTFADGYDKTNAFYQQYVQARDYIARGTEQGKESIIDWLENRTEVTKIKEISNLMPESFTAPGGSEINWDPTAGFLQENFEGVNSPALALAHEAFHVQFGTILFDYLRTNGWGEANRSITNMEVNNLAKNLPGEGSTRSIYHHWGVVYRTTGVTSTYPATTEINRKGSPSAQGKTSTELFRIIFELNRQK